MVQFLPLKHKYLSLSLQCSHKVRHGSVVSSSSQIDELVQ